MSDLDHLATTMPNLNSISLSRCAYDNHTDAFGFMSPRDPGSSFPFPHLKRLTVLEPGPGLISLGRRRKEYGVPLETVIIGSEPRLYTPEQIMELGEFVDDVRVEIPPDMPELSVWNRILDTWSRKYGVRPGFDRADSFPQDTLTSLRDAFKYLRFNGRKRSQE